MLSKTRLFPTLSRIALLAPFVMAPVTGFAAADLFSDDFESALVTTPKPVLSWQTPFNPTGGQMFGMMYGKGDVYERSTTIAHSGAYSLRLNFDGRNGFGNRDICGNTTYTAVVSGSSFTLSNGGVLPAGGTIFDKTDRFARYDLPATLSGAVVSGSGVVPVGATIRNDMGGVGYIKNGDEILVQNCVTTSSSRLNDMNLAINYLNNTGNVSWPYGGTLARRMYVYFPSATTMPEVTFKLGYLFTDIAESFIVDMTSRSSGVEVDNTPLYKVYEIPKYYFKRDTWYYVEELFKKETSAGAGDAGYTLYVAADGQNSTTPLIQRVGGFNYGTLKQISIVGNWQHLTASKGYVYLDDVAIGTSRLGPVSGTTTVASPPSAPLLQVK